MKFIEKVMRFFRIFLFAFMLAVCMVIGVAPIIPKRKEQFEIAAKMEQEKIDVEGTISLNKAE
jgi:type IV secretory pathway component VirB8